MSLKSVGCLCLYFVLITCARSQRLDSWASPSQSGYNNDKFSNWNSKNNENEFSPTQNSQIGSWGSNLANDLQPVSTNWETDSFSSNGNKKTSGSNNNNNKKSDLWSFSSNNEPDKNTQTWESENSYGKNKNWALSSWDSNKLFEGKTPKKSNTGNSGNWQSDAFNLNNRPNEKKSASITNNYATSPSNSNWKSDSNTFSSNSNNENSGYSSWGSSNSNNINNPERPSNSDENSGYSSWGSSNSNKNINNPKQLSNPNENSGYSSWGSSNSYNGNSKSTLNSNNENSGYSSWGSSNSNNNNNPKQPSNSKENSGYSSWGSSNSNNDNSKSTSNSSNEYRGYSSWGSSNSNNNNYPKQPSNSKQNSGYSFWDSSNSNNNNPKSTSNSSNENSGYSSWGSSNSNNNINKLKKSSNSNNNQNFGSENSSIDDGGNDVLSSSDYEDNSVYPSWNSNNENLKPSSSSNVNWVSDTQNSKNNKSSQPNKKKTSNDKNTSFDNSKNTSGWDANISYKKKPGKGEKEADTSRPSNNQSEKKPSTLDTSILDELDKNDWYFRKESDYPTPPFRSSLNIDVSELWNFDKNKKSNLNIEGSSNKRRKNRQIGQFGKRRVQCECVNVELCDEDDMIITQEDLGNDWHPLRVFRCDHLTEVCCKNPKPRRQSDRTNIEEESQQKLRCGERRISRNFGDTIAQPGEFPWNLRLENYNSDANCSASLINSKMALTAAHCVDSTQPSNLQVIAGLWSSNDEPSQRRRVMKIIIHPDYKKENPRNDIALLVLENPFKLSENVNTICLPVTNDKWNPNQCFVTGWRQKEINGEVVEVLKKGIVGFLPQYECQNIMLVTDLWRNYILHDSFVCGIEKIRQDHCLGNEGSSIACLSEKLPDTYIQIGIVSNSMNCDEWGRPGIFTNVLKFLDWINENTFDLGLIDNIDVRSLL